MPPSIATSLNHLTNRPGVIATLILGRKDGSIIRATGVLSESQSASSSNRPVSNGSATLNEDEGTEISETTSTSERQENPKQEPTPAEILAAAVVTFVSSATSVSGGLRDALSGASSRANPFGMLNGATQNQSQTNFEKGDSEAGRGATEVQLLRMRTKKHEVVIFPDNRFLCCVVQEVGKVTQGSESAMQKT